MIEGPGELPTPVWLDLSTGRYSERALEQDPELAYMLPRHPAEGDRLDVQHYSLLATLGTNVIAPVQAPARVLDVGSGSGQWGHDVARQFPAALVIGLDVEPGKAGGPDNYRLVRANLLRGLPFADESFDYVHQRLMATSAIPRAAWPGVLADLVRVTVPGGWIELVEVVVRVAPAGPATQRLFELTRLVGRDYGVDTDAVVIRVLGDHLGQAGLVEVEQRNVDFPVGEWGGRTGSLMASNLRALHARLAAAYEARLGVTQGEVHDLLTAMQEECERLHSQCMFVIAVGRRPPA